MDTRRVATFAPGETRAFTIPGAAGANAVAVNLTSVTTQPGYWQVYPMGGAVPATSNLNSPPGLSAVAANQAIVTVDAGGAINIFSEQGGDLLIDLVGTYTGASAPASTVGLFVPTTSPTRIVDTRVPALNPLGGTDAPRAGIDLRSSRLEQPGDRAIRRLRGRAQRNERRNPHNRIRHGGNRRSDGSRSATLDVDDERRASRRRSSPITPSSRCRPAGSRCSPKPVATCSPTSPDTSSGVRRRRRSVRPVNAPSPTCTTPKVGYPTVPVGPIVWGSSRASVATLQGRLLALGFWNGGADGGYGLTTVQAVMAFQKWKGLPATTVVDVATATALNLQVCRPGAGTTTGTAASRSTRASRSPTSSRTARRRYIFNVSTGNGESYDEEDQKNAGARSIGIALTPTGTFRTYRESDDRSVRE